MTVLAAFSRLKLPASGNLPMLSPHILPFFPLLIAMGFWDLGLALYGEATTLLL